MVNFLSNEIQKEKETRENPGASPWAEGWALAISLSKLPQMMCSLPLNLDKMATMHVRCFALLSSILLLEELQEVFKGLAV